MPKRWSFSDLVTDHQTGKLRETAVWSNVGKGTMTWAFVALTNSGRLTEFYVMAFGALVIGHELAARFFNQKQQVMDKQNVEPTRPV